MSKLRAIGLMSGTSLDGIDIALLETDGEDAVRRLGGATVAYPPEFRGALQAAIAAARGLDDRTARPGILAGVEEELTRRHAEAVLTFIGDRMLQPSAIDVIGFHGQTVLHRDQERDVVLRQGLAGTLLSAIANGKLGSTERQQYKLTVQLGDGALLARLTGIDVVHDLRAADCAAGGQGAPLVPVYHRALAANLPQRPVAVLNIGGVANVTWIGGDGRLIAFDTGPGNALINDWMQRRRGVPHDEGGALAATGRVHEGYVTEYLKHSHFATPPPKSLDRNAFPLELVDALSAADGAATLTAFTAEAIARARAHMPVEPALWIVGGGGRRNRTLMSMLAARVENAVVPAEAVGLDGDTLEAEAWAYLAVRSVKGLVITFPGTTGIAKPMTGGVLARAPGPR